MNQETALNYLKSGHNVFLTGQAGAGKTYTLAWFIRWLHEHSVRFAVTASTGLAATHLHGQTIHSWAGIGVKQELSPKQLKVIAEKRKEIKRVKVLIIDEISMLHARQLNLVNQVLQQIHLNSKPFGGIQVVACGDFFQLPPVGNPGDTPATKFSFMQSVWADAGFTICYLTEQHRQDDNHLNKILNEIRSNSVTEESIIKLRSTQRQIIDDELTKLYTHNVNVDAINQHHLKEIDSPSQFFIALKKGESFLVDQIQNSLRLADKIELKKDALVLFMKNNKEKGYVNGTVGRITGFTQNTEFGLVPEVHTIDGIFIEVEPEKWEVTNDNDKEVASFTQIPLRLAWAITVHKSQGMTLDAAEIDLSKTFERGQGYVALSRLKSMKNLRLLGFNDKALEVEPLVLKADKRFQELSAEAEANANSLNFDELHTCNLKKIGSTKRRPLPPVQRRTTRHRKQEHLTDWHKTIRQQFEEGISLDDIADEHGMTVGTVLLCLKEIREVLPDYDFSRIKPRDDIIDEVKTVTLNYLHKNKSLSGFESINLKQLKQFMQHPLTVNDIRIARLFIPELDNPFETE